MKSDLAFTERVHRSFQTYFKFAGFRFPNIATLFPYLLQAVDIEIDLNMKGRALNPLIQCIAKLVHILRTAIALLNCSIA